MYEILCFWALCLFFLSARSVSSRAALRPERAVLNQPEFQGWFAGAWELCVLSIDLRSGNRFLQRHISFFACEKLILSARSVSSRAALRPVRAGFRISPPGIRAGWCGIGDFSFVD